MDKHESTGTPLTSFISRHTPLLLLLSAALPALASADIQVDNPAGPTQVVQSPRGVPVINIAEPNSGGLSHNRFQRFDVDTPGAIFNNSLNSGPSQLGGRVEANPNLTRHAQAILAEVTGNQPSTLAGAVEVFGGKADVIVANPNGITLNGVTTYNMNGFAVSTGRPEWADGLYLNVENGSGRVVIGANGLDTTGLSYFDVVARAVALNGRVGAPGATTSIQVVTGLNRYQSQVRSSSSSASSEPQVPGVAIDGSLAGAMYGGHISLISTESGAGVRHAGLIQSAQDILIQTDGDIDLPHTDPTAPSYNAMAPSGIQAARTLQVMTSGTISAGTHIQARNITVQAKALNLTAATLKATGYDPTKTALYLQLDALNLKGQLLAHDSRSGTLLERDQPVLMKDGKLQVMRRAGQYDEHFTLASQAKIESAGGIVISTDHIGNDQGVIDDQSTLGLSINTSVLSNLGVLRSQGAVELNADQLDNRCTGNSAAQSLCGGVFGKTNATIWAGTLNNQGGLVAGNDLILTLGEGQHSNGTTAAIAAGNNLLVAGPTNSHLFNNGELLANRDGEITLDTLDNGANGAVTAFGNLSMDIHSVFTTAGYLASRGLTTLAAHDLQVNSGAYMAFGAGLSVDTLGDITAERNVRLYSRGTINLKAAGVLASAASVFSDGDLMVHAEGMLTNTGDLVSNRNIELSSGHMVKNDNGALVHAGENLVLTSLDNLSNLNSSMLLSELGLIFNVTNTFLNDQSIVEGGDVMINAQTMLNRHTSLIHGLEALNIKVGTLQDNTEGSILQVGDHIVVQADLMRIGR